MRFTFFIATFVASIALVSALPTEIHKECYNGPCAGHEWKRGKISKDGNGFGSGTPTPGWKRVEGSKADPNKAPYPAFRRHQDSEDWSSNGNEWKRGKISKENLGGTPSPTF